MSDKACSKCRHFEEFSCHIRGVCTLYSRSTQATGSCGGYDAARGQHSRKSGGGDRSAVGSAT